MAERRSSDALGVKSLFRSNRMPQQAGKWYFETREGSLEGPFDTELDAAVGLDDYVKIMSSGLLEDDSELTLQPLRSFTMDS